MNKRVLSILGVIVLAVGSGSCDRADVSRSRAFHGPGSYYTFSTTNTASGSFSLIYRNLLTSIDLTTITGANTTLSNQMMRLYAQVTNGPAAPSFSTEASRQLTGFYLEDIGIFFSSYWGAVPLALVEDQSCSAAGFRGRWITTSSHYNITAGKPAFGISRLSTDLSTLSVDGYALNDPATLLTTLEGVSAGYCNSGVLPMSGSGFPQNVFVTAFGVLVMEAESPIDATVFAVPEDTGMFLRHFVGSYVGLYFEPPTSEGFSFGRAMRADITTAGAFTMVEVDDNNSLVPGIKISSTLPEVSHGFMASTFTSPDATFGSGGHLACTGMREPKVLLCNLEFTKSGIRSRVAMMLKEAPDPLPSDISK